MTGVVNWHATFNAFIAVMGRHDPGLFAGLPNGSNMDQNAMPIVLLGALPFVPHGLGHISARLD